LSDTRKRFKATYIVYASDISLVDKSIRNGLGEIGEVTLEDEIRGNIKVGY